LAAIRRFAADFPTVRLQEGAQAFAHDLMVVRYQDTKVRHI